MSFLFTRLQKMYNKLINRVNVKKLRKNTVVIDSQMYISGSDTEPETETETDTAPAPAPETSPDAISLVISEQRVTNMNTRITDRSSHLLFNNEIPTTTICCDYELQELIKIVSTRSINVERVILHDKFESLLSKLTDKDIIFKTKMRLLYVIIACNIYRQSVEEKKLYKSQKTNHYVGVFRYSDYIIRVDDSPYCFQDEECVISAIRNHTTNDETFQHIVIPYFTYINIKKNANGEICDCSSNICDCVYVDADAPVDDAAATDADTAADAATDPKTTEITTDTKLEDYSRIFYNKLRYNTLSFSIQPCVKHSESLYSWVGVNITDNVNMNFLKFKHIFYTHLFYKCARLLQKIHAIGIVHGDIKPDNILIKEEPGFNINDPIKSRLFSVYLIDFGLSGKDNVGIGTGGTIPYCHPEFQNIRDTRRTDKYRWNVIKKKHDVWSLGLAFITLYIHRSFYNYYYKYPSYFFNSSGYVSAIVLGSIGNQSLNRLFIDILSYDSISIDEVCNQLRVLL